MTSVGKSATLKNKKPPPAPPKSIKTKPPPPPPLPKSTMPDIVQTVSSPVRKLFLSKPKICRLDATLLSKLLTKFNRRSLLLSDRNSDWNS